MKKILKHIGLIAIAFVVALSAVFIPFKNKNNDIQSASALNSPSWQPSDNLPSTDTSIGGYSGFLGSNTVFAAVGMVPTTTTTITDFSVFIPNYNLSFNSKSPFFMFKFMFLKNTGYNVIDFKFNAVSYDFYSINKLPYNNPPVPNNGYVNLTSIDYSSLKSSFVPDTIMRQSLMSDYLQVFSTDNTQVDFGATYFANTFFGTEIIYKGSEFVEPTLDIVSIEYTNSIDFNSLYGFEPAFTFSNIIIYTDSAGWSFLYYIPSFANVTVQTDSYAKYSYYFEYRKYYTENALNFSDNDYYNQGVSDGYTDGYIAGESFGYNKGYNAGELDGYYTGKIDGANAAGNYTFLSLIGAVFDAPLNAFTSLFNFEILGVNLLSFLSSLLTLAIVIWVLKLVLGGK